jgi:hypothetical protein
VVNLSPRFNGLWSPGLSRSSGVMLFVVIVAALSIRTPTPARAASATTTTAATTTETATATTTATTAKKPFRLLGPATNVGGLARPALLQAALFSRINATKKTQEAKDCSDRPQIRDAPAVFVLPGQPGKRLACTVAADALVLIDHNGAICNQSKKTKADVACVEGRLSKITEYSVTVDGINLGVRRFKTISEAFVVTTKDGNAFGFAPGKWKIIAAGWPVSIDKLSPGLHEIITRYRIGDLSRQTITVDLTVAA